MVSRTLSIATLLVVALAAGCFDVHAVDPGPYVIDDFDDSDFYPPDPRLARWTCYAFNPDSNKMYSCDNDIRYDNGPNANYSLFVDFTITDPVNGKQDDGGAGLSTYANKPIDFTGFEQIDFSVMLESLSPPIPTNAQLSVEFGCSTAPDDKGNVPGDFYVVQGAGYDRLWTTVELTLNNFAPPSWIVRHIAGGTAGCLKRVDSIRFSVDARLPDGATGRGLLRIDDVRLE
jgi:hypothetical protein